MSQTFDDIHSVLVAGIETIQCECGWEAVFVVPEETQRMRAAMIVHLVNHNPNHPVWTLTQH